MRLKKIMTVLLSFFFLCSTHVTAFASDITITANVPGSHTITVDADGAEVFCDGAAGSSFTVERLSGPKLLIRAESGREITEILLNGENITKQIRGGYYTLEPVYEDQTITVMTDEAPAAQGKTYTVQGTVMRNGQPVSGITMELRSRLKTYVTDANGKFSFADVECGKHSLTALKNGEIVGYVEFILLEGNQVDLSLTDGVYTVNTNQNAIGIDLVLTLESDDTMRMTEAKEVSGAPKKEPASGGNGSNSGSGGSQTGGGKNGSSASATSPKTGDTADPMMWFAVLLISGALVQQAVFIFDRKKKQQ